MTEDVVNWLTEIGLASYASVFAENEIDLDAARDLTDSDLKELQLPMGPRKKLLRAISKLTVGSGPNILPEQRGQTSSDQGQAPAEQHVPQVERRQLTVMFCDLVGSTALSSHLDPEDMREILHRYQDVVAGIVTRNGGYVANYLGDGVLTYFGWPIAHDDQAVHAVHAALAAVEAVPEIETPHGKPLSARVGIATGQVVVGDLEGQVTKQPGAIAGETPNLAARLEGLAEPGQVVVGDLTRRLVGSQFTLADYGSHSLKGLSGSVQAWRIAGKHEAETRFQARRIGSLPTVGREHELGLLEDKWRDAVAGEGQAVLISGEAGIGKSHLVHALLDRTADCEKTVLRYQCSSYHTQTAYYPIAQHIERAARWTANEKLDARLDRLAALFGRSGEAVKLMANLLRLPFETRHGTIDLPPEALRRRTTDTLIQQVISLSEVRPVFMLFEDTHWLDRSSQEVLSELVSRMADVPLYLLMTHRPEWSPRWGPHSHVAMLPLSRFSRRACREIIFNIAGSRISEETAAQIIQRADGVPLFVEEIAKSLIEQGPHSVLSDIPDTLQASLSARLDRLSTDQKEIVQVGSVIGREFRHQLIVELIGKSEEALVAGLEQLEATSLLHRRGTRPDAKYLFSHALVQDAAYASCLRERRRSLHLAVAELLTGSRHGFGQAEPGLVAYHYEESGRNDQAITYRQLAGDEATAQSAGDEAALHYRAALEILAKGDSSDCPEIELDVCLKLANALMLIGGYASRDAYDAWERGRMLASKYDDTENYFRAALGVVPTMLAQGKYASALDLFCDYTVNDVANLSHINQVHYNVALGILHMCTGELESAKPFLERGLALNDQSPCTPRNPWAGADPEIVLRSYEAMLRIAQLAPAAAEATANAALRAAEYYDDPFGSVWSKVIKLRTLVWCGKYEDAVKYAELAEIEANRHGFKQRVGNILTFRGIAHIGCGLTDVGVKEVNQGLEIWAEKGGLFHLTQWYCDAAAVSVRADRFDAAAQFLDSALAFEKKMELPTAEAELFRLRGVRAAHDGDRSAAQAFFRRAREVAHAKGAALCELRTALDELKLDIICDTRENPMDVLNRLASEQKLANQLPETLEAKQYMSIWR
ncbi:MAG: AAA family ATPase [Hyphomicrobiaceae bacterium]